jgi:MtfA peptidase
MWNYRHWRRRRILANCRIPERRWRSAMTDLPSLRGLSEEDCNRLKALAVLFMHEKTFEGAGGLRVTDDMRLIIALQACLPILNLGLEWYRGWVSIVIYPGGFTPDHAYTDEIGVVHTSRRALCGEAWLHGPVVLSWPDVEAGSLDRHNLVIHEFAHKLDMCNGVANGMPPLHRNMDVSIWTRDFSRAFKNFQRDLTHTETATRVDPYAGESPAEFFAVLSELFFEAADVVTELCPAVYCQLRDFYRQDPAGRTAK